MTRDQIKLKRANIEWMQQLARGCTHAVTLTLKPYRMVMTDRGLVSETLGETEAKANFRHFLNRLNENLFRNAAKRFGKSITVIPVLAELHSHKSPHYHCAMGGFPDRFPTNVIPQIIASAWHQTHFGNDQVDVRPMTTAFWLAYIGQDTGTRNRGLVDVENSRFPTAT